MGQESSPPPPRQHSIASKTGCHSRIVIRPSTRGSPKYWIGKEPASVARMRAHRSLSSANIPNPMKVDLARLRLRPEKSENISRRAETFSAAATEPSIKKIVSSANCNRGTPLGLIQEMQTERERIESYEKTLAGGSPRISQSETSSLYQLVFHALPGCT